jgi:hypothetical protein
MDAQSARRIRAVRPPEGQVDLRVDHQLRLRPRAEDTCTSGALKMGQVDQVSWSNRPESSNPCAEAERSSDVFMGRGVTSYFASPRPIWVWVTGIGPIRPDKRQARAPRRAVAPRPVASARAARTHGVGPAAGAARARASSHKRVIAEAMASSSCRVGEPLRTRTSGGSVTAVCCRACAAPVTHAWSAASRAR